MEDSSGTSDSGDQGRDDPEASSSVSQSNGVEDALTSFREQWMRELNISPKHDSTKNQSSKPVANDVIDDAASIEEKAQNLFLKGVEHEQTGKLYEASRFYKRAIQLVPDIEIRLYELTKAKNREERVEKLENETSEVINDNVDEHSEDNENGSNLFTKLVKIVNYNQCVCFPKNEQSTTHISALPMEIVLYILRWVVSSELDLRSLEMFSRVCRGFYISARDAEIWRLACIRVWGEHCGMFAPKYQSWREMYLQRPRPRYNGCYISKISYVRHGENSYQDQFYRPWHSVKYFRCLRFFPEGKVLMLTSTDEAQTCFNSLKYRTPRNPSVLLGHYRIRDNFVTLVLNRQDKGYSTDKWINWDPLQDGQQRTFHVEFEIQNYHRKFNSQLKWLRYDMSAKLGNGQELAMNLIKSSITSINYNGGYYPPFRFSRVKSYAQESEAPLH